MIIKDIVAEDFLNYKRPSMFIATAKCDWKCGAEYCQNTPLAKAPSKEIPNETIYKMYHNNDITKAIVVGGLEPMLQFEELSALISLFRERGDQSTFVIYTGYNRDEIDDKVELLRRYGNIIIKFGRYIPGQSVHYDHILGVNLASDNQYAEQIS